MKYLTKRDKDKFIVMKVKRCKRQRVPGYGKVAVTLSTGEDIWAIFVVEEFMNNTVKLKPTEEFEMYTQHTWWHRSKIDEWLNEGLAVIVTDYDIAKEKLNLIKKVYE